MNSVIELPLDPEMVFDIITTGKDLKDCSIDVSQAINAIPNNKLFVYLRNVNIFPTLDFSNCTVEDKINAFNQWLDLAQLYENELMSQTLFQLIAMYNFPDMEIITHSIFTNDQCIELLKQERFKTLAKTVTEYVCNSLTCITDEFCKLGVIDNDIIDNYQIIDDVNCIPLNSVWLFTIPIITYIIANCNVPQKYFKVQYQQPIYDGLTIHEYIHNSDNYIGLISDVLVN